MEAALIISYFGLAFILGMGPIRGIIANLEDYNKKGELKDALTQLKPETVENIVS